MYGVFKHSHHAVSFVYKMISYCLETRIGLFVSVYTLETYILNYSGFWKVPQCFLPIKNSLPLTAIVQSYLSYHMWAWQACQTLDLDFSILKHGACCFRESETKHLKSSDFCVLPFLELQKKQKSKSITNGLNNRCVCS